MTDLQNDLTDIQINDGIDENTNPQDPIRVKTTKESFF